MKKTIALLLSVALTAAVAIGGTFINHHPGVSNTGYIDLGESYEVISEVKGEDTYYTVVPKE